MEARYGSQIERVRYGAAHSPQYANSDELHLLWRYGVSAETAGVEAAVQKLEEVAHWLETEAI